MISGAPISGTPISGESGATFISVSIVESGSAVDTPVMSRLIVGQPVAETGSAQDHPSATLTFHVDVQEFGHAADIEHLPPGHTFVADFLHAADTASRTLILTASVAEHGHAADLTRRAPPPHVHETGNAQDFANVAVNGNWHLRVRETGSATDAPSATVFVHAAVHETATAHTTLSEGYAGHFNVSVIESAAAWDTSTNLFITHPYVNEHANASDRIGHNVGPAGHYTVSVVETGNAVDSTVDPETYSSLGVYFWNYQWAVNEGITELAVWCAGLDCGNWPVDPAGFVFVPWGADPDGFFTPSYLFSLENNPPLGFTGGFGASSCNIDLVTNSGSVTRVITDLAIGLPYTSQIQLLRPNAPEQNHSQFGPGLGLTRRLSRYAAQLQNTGDAISFGTVPDNLLKVNFTATNGGAIPSSVMFSGVYRNFIYDDYTYDGMLMAQVDRPYPAMIVALASIFTTIDLE